MRLDLWALGVIIIFFVIWLVTAFTGLLAVIPYGIFGLVPIAIVLGLLVAVIYQRLTNKEDNYYSKNIDK